MDSLWKQEFTGGRTHLLQEVPNITTKQDYVDVVLFVTTVESLASNYDVVVLVNEEIDLQVVLLTLHYHPVGP